MEHLSVSLQTKRDLLTQDTGSKKEGLRITSERAEIIRQILAKINAERQGTKYKQMKPAYLGVKLAHIPTKDLYYLHTQALDYEKRKGSYGKYIFGAIKVKK